MNRFFFILFLLFRLRKKFIFHLLSLGAEQIARHNSREGGRSAAEETNSVYLSAMTRRLGVIDRVKEIQR